MTPAAKPAVSHANPTNTAVLSRLSITAAARPKQLWGATAPTNPRQGYHLPRQGKTREATGNGTGAAQHPSWGSNTRSCFAARGSPLAGGAMPPPAKVSPLA